MEIVVGLNRAARHRLEECGEMEGRKTVTQMVQGTWRSAVNDDGGLG